MSALTDSEFAQVRELLDIADDWAEYGYVRPADVRAVKRRAHSLSFLTESQRHLARLAAEAGRLEVTW